MPTPVRQYEETKSAWVIFLKMYRRPPNITVYVLECEQGKYYVGRTTNPEGRIEEHVEGAGSQWTKLFPPIKTIALYPNSDTFDEDKHTKICMAKYGIENVRGGSYVNIDLDDGTIENLKKELFNSDDRCFRCGRKGHFANGCPYSTLNENPGFHNLGPEDMEVDDDYAGAKSNTKLLSSPYSVQMKSIKKVVKTPMLCSRCGRTSHSERSCYAKTTIDGKYLKSQNSESEESDDDCCYRCGRPGHFANACYAKTHVDGYKLR